MKNCSYKAHREKLLMQSLMLQTEQNMLSTDSWMTGYTLRPDYTAFDWTI